MFGSPYVSSIADFVAGPRQFFPVVRRLPDSCLDTRKILKFYDIADNELSRDRLGLGLDHRVLGIAELSVA
jgi:hypothetical protein